MPPTVDNVIKNIIEEVHSTDVAPKSPVYNMGKLSLDVFRKPVLQKQSKGFKVKPDPNFLLDDNIIFRKVVKFRYSVEPSIVIGVGFSYCWLNLEE